MSSDTNHGESETVGFWREDHVDGCYAPLTDKECDCPPARYYVPVDAVVEALRDRQRHGASTGTVGWADRAADFIEREFGAAS